MHETTRMGLGHAVALLAAMVVAVPLFRRFGLGSVLGYLAAGLVIGPFGARRGATTPRPCCTSPSSAWSCSCSSSGWRCGPRGCGACARRSSAWARCRFWPAPLLLTGIALLAGLAWYAALIAGFGFVLSSTAIVMQLLDERNENAEPARPARGLHPAVRGPGHRAAAGAGGGAGAAPAASAVETGQPIWLTIGLAIARRGAGLCRRPLGGEPVLPPAGPLRRPRGDDLARPAGGAGRGLRDERWAGCRWPWAPSWPACCCRNRPSATSSRPTSSRSAASCWACSSSASACRWTCAWSSPTGPGCSAAWSPSWRSRWSAIYAVARLSKAEARRGACSAPP